MRWNCHLRGGDLHGETFNLALDGAELHPPPVLYAWRCHMRCPGHATFDVNHPEIDLGRVNAYRREQIDTMSLTAIYVLGDTEPTDAPHLVAEERLPEPVMVIQGCVLCNGCGCYACCR